MASRSIFAKTLGFLVGAPVMVAIVLFAIDNQHPVEIGFWPLPLTVEVPAFFLGLCTLATGFLLGIFAVWLTGGSVRRRARLAESKARRLETDLDARTHEVADLKKALPAPEAR